MRGVIIKKFSGKPYSFIQGEDQKEYFLHKKECIVPKDYERYCWKGNTVEFIVSSELSGVRPVAKNVKFTPKLNIRSTSIAKNEKKHEEKFVRNFILNLFLKEMQEIENMMKNTPTTYYKLAFLR